MLQHLTSASHICTHTLTLTLTFTFLLSHCVWAARTKVNTASSNTQDVTRERCRKDWEQDKVCAEDSLVRPLRASCARLCRETGGGYAKEDGIQGGRPFDAV
jgi:hypothetical protein